MNLHGNRWVFGVHPVLELLRANPEGVREILMARRANEKCREIERLAKERHVFVRQVHRREIEARASGEAHQGVVAELASDLEGGVYPDPGEPLALLERAREAKEEPLIVALDQIQDPRNLGAIVRSAHAFGAHGVVVPKDRSSEMTPVAVKASAGAAAHLPVCRVTNLARTLNDLKSAGLWVVGADVARPGDGDERQIFAPDDLDLTVPLVIVIGSEGPGLRRLVRDRCDMLARIPMVGRIGSINASVAGGVLLYEVLRQRKGSRGEGNARE